MSKKKPAVSVTNNQPFDATSVAIATPPLEIRKIRLWEMFARTGNAVCHFCVKNREATSFSPEAVTTRYHRLKGRPAWALYRYGSFVLFHEVYTLGGDYFAHPQVLSSDPLMLDDLQLWEAEAFTFEPNEWVMTASQKSAAGRFEYYSYPYGWPDRLYQTTPKEFQRDLDFALAPYAIDDLEHPLAHQLITEPDPW